MTPPRKPRALVPGAAVHIVSPASPPVPEMLVRGLAELRRLGYEPVAQAETASTNDYFASPARDRVKQLASALADKRTGALICTRGGYGSTYLLGDKFVTAGAPPKILLGYSDITSLDVYLWEKRRWVTFYGPMVATEFSNGPGSKDGYDEASFRTAVAQARGGWTLALEGQTLRPGEAKGVLLGGCLTLLEATLGTPWELDTRGSILVLEDRGMKPYQVDRVLTHLRQAEKFAGVRAIVLGEFPDSVPTVEGSPTVRDVVHRILGALKIPIVWAARVGHTPRPMLTLPLGVRARLIAKDSGTLEILEPAVIP
jgi:muramoyltetrapeptide carboxypeptidase